MKLRSLMTAASASAVLACTASAASTYIDFATPAGSTTLVGTDTWNTVSTTAPTGLSATTPAGLSGTITLTFSSSGAGFGGGAFNSGDTVGATAPAFLMSAGVPIASAIGDGIFVNDGFNGAHVTFNFTDLAASTAYQFTVYGGRNDGGFSSPGLIQDITGATTLASYTNRTSATFNVNSDATGALAFRFTEGETSANTSSNSTMVGMSFTAIPEPSAALLGALGCIGLISRRRR